MRYNEALYYVWSVRCGKTEDLLRRVGNVNFSAIIRRGYIVRGLRHPEVWKISEKGLDFLGALYTRSWIRRLIDGMIMWGI